MEVNSTAPSTWKDVSDKRWGNLISQPDHYQIKGSWSQGADDNLSSEIKVGGDEKSPGILWRAYRTVSRTQAQRDQYRNGIENVRELLREKYDQNAVERFDNHFSYRRWAGKPLIVRAFKVFIAKEEELRQGGVNVSTLGQNAETLEDLKSALPPGKPKKDYRIIGGSKVPSANKTDYVFCFLPIKRSWFEFSADAKDKKKGGKEGIEEARKAILDLIPKEATKKHVEHLFNCHFAEKIEKKEPLTVRELSSFIDDAIIMRDDESKILGGLYSAAISAKDAGEDVASAICTFLQGTYHATGIAAGAAVVANAEAGVNDPITALAKGIAAGTLVASENDTERILTAFADHFVATPPAAQSTWSSASILKFFTFGLY